MLRQFVLYVRLSVHPSVLLFVRLFVCYTLDQYKTVFTAGGIGVTENTILEKARRSKCKVGKVETGKREGWKTRERHVWTDKCYLSVVVVCLES